MSQSAARSAASAAMLPGRTAAADASEPQGKKRPGPFAPPPSDEGVRKLRRLKAQVWTEKELDDMAHHGQQDEHFHDEDGAAIEELLQLVVIVVNNISQSQ